MAQVIAKLMLLLEAARYQPINPIALGHRVVERVLHLSRERGELQLFHFADVVSWRALHVKISFDRIGLSGQELSLNCPLGAPLPACLLCGLGSGPPQVEALAQLRCLDAVSATLAIQLAGGTARKLEEGQRLAVGQLSQLARIMQSLSIAAGKCGTCRVGTHGAFTCERT